MHKVNNAQRAAIFKALADARAPMRYGEVSSYDPKTYSAKVIIQPEGIETGWLPILAMGNGGGWGIYCGLLPPAQVAVIHFEGDRDNGLVLGVTPNSTDQPPQVPGGEMWTVHKSGSFLKFTNDGKVSLSTDSDLDITVGGQLNATITGKLVASASEFDLTGDLKVTGTIKATEEVSAFNGAHTVSQHTHTQPDDSHGDTEEPTNTPTG